MALRRTRTALAAPLLLTMALLGAACTKSNNRADTPSTTTERSSGGPSTTTPFAETPKPDGPSPVQDGTRIEVLSSQPDRASGPDARIRVSPAAGSLPQDLVVTLADRDITGQLKVTKDGRLEGVITGLIEGTNTLKATDSSDTKAGPVTQRIRSWPLAGPMISGSHLPLLACSTEENGLGKATDANCSAPTKVTWRYLSTAGTIKELPDPKARPADLATATVAGRKNVGLTIRYEQGVVNRSVYEIATVDPSPGGADSDQSDVAWNRRLIYRFGDGCGTTFGQGTANVEALDPAYLRKGYAVATATFNTGAVQCNDVLSAETTMMVKERVIETFGVPDTTIGEGTGGGAAQVHLIAQNYPGLIDGAVALEPLPDIVTVASGAADCGLLNRYYRSPGGTAVNPAQRAAINGHASSSTCNQWEAGYGGLFNPTDGCDPKIPDTQIYDATTNPEGIRCTLQDANINQFGREPLSGFAERPLDNIGVQYGLTAVQEGDLSFDQFLALNQAIGGYDADGLFQKTRTSATQPAVATAYETGRVSSGSGDQLKIPMIDVDIYNDPDGDIHDRFRAFSLRDRLTRGGTAESAPGFQIWTRDPGTLAGAEARLEVVATMDTWLTAINKDTKGGERFTVLSRTRPAAAVDNCIPQGTTKPTGGGDIYDTSGPCKDDYPIAGDPRTAAGAPRSDDVIKCRLSAVDAAAYGIELTPDQITKLGTVFPQGVCDYSSGGLGQTTPSMSDRSYEDVLAPGDRA